MNRVCLLLLVLLLFPMGCRKNKPSLSQAPKETTVVADHSALRAELGKLPDLAGISFGVVGEVKYESRRATVFWPAIQNGKILDDDIVAAVYKKEGLEWKQVSLPGLSGAEGKRALFEAMDSEAPTVFRECGVPKSDLPTVVSRSVKLFREALEEGNTNKAIAVYESMTRGFSWDNVAYEDMIPEILISAPENLTLSCTEEKCKFVTESGPEADIEFMIQSCGDGFVLHMK